MIIKGRSRGRSGDLAAHLMRADQNERIQLYEMRGTIAGDVQSALSEMETYGLAARSARPLYHASISPEAHTPLSPDQIRVAVDTLEAALGLGQQPRVIVVHAKKGREHVHVVWSRVEIDRGRVISDSWNYRAHEQAARTLEVMFGHRPLPGSRSKRDKLSRATEEYELRQEERAGQKASQVSTVLRQLWAEANDGQEFVAKLESAGYRLARGDKRVFVIVDPHGEVHSLARRIGCSTHDLRDRLKGLRLEALRSVAEIRLPTPVNPSPNVAAQFRLAASAMALCITPRLAAGPNKTHRARPANYHASRTDIIAHYASKLAIVFSSAGANERQAAVDAIVAERDAALIALNRNARVASSVRSPRIARDPLRWRILVKRDTRSSQ